MKSTLQDLQVGGNPPQGCIDDQVMDIFPNPASETISVRFKTDMNGMAFLIIRDVSGKQIAMKNVAVIAGENQLQVSVGEFSPGVYISQLVFPVSPGGQFLKFLILR